ncbi:DNA polymerase [Striga asiatica]|uniref:DNA-directed DNA polymerase n=1 Tax=Striga asiatica TaxID=4170 RepID=A0A5A7RHG9_STRAF|nr:DNA polymerase [Striga asiatica]
MAKMGFSAPTTPFRPSSFSPPYFWLCRSYTQLYSFSSWSRVFCRLGDRVRPSGSGLNDDLIVRKQRKSYSTYRDYEINGGQVSSWSYSPLKGPVVRREEDCNEVVDGQFIPEHKATDWAFAGQVHNWNRKRYVYKANIAANLQTLPEEEIAGRLRHGSQERYERKGEGGSKMAVGSLMTKPTCQNGLEDKGYRDSNAEKNNVNGIKESASADEKANLSDSVAEDVSQERTVSESEKARERLSQVYDKVLVVDDISAAREVVRLLTTQYTHLIHACDTEVANIDVKEETPVDHGEIICFSIYSGPQADFGNGKSCVWVDVLDGGGRDIIKEFAPFFEDPSIKKVWHNYSFDNHVIENYGLKVSGFYADTMHMARLWNASRRMEGGYSLEALTGDRTVMENAKSGPDQMDVGKVSMKTIFGKKKMKKDGSEGKLVTIPPVEELQRTERKLWICYSALDSISTLRLYESLENKLKKAYWCVDGVYKGSMFENYQRYLQPFGELLVKMETEGMLVNRLYLAEIEKVAKAEQQIAADRFRKWASKYCPDAKYMNVGSDTQLRQFLFGGIQNRKDPNEFLDEKEVKVPNVDNIIEEGKKSPTKFHKIVLRKPDFVNIKPEKYTASGWPSVSGDVLRSLAGKVSADFDFLDEENDEEQPENMTTKYSECHKANPIAETDISAYGEAYSAFGGGQAGIEACHAFAALCESCAIDSLLSNFIIPLQGNHISGKNGRIHCSINLNTETGRLSARRPNLQNQPALEKDRYKIRKAFVAAPGNSLIVADYGQLELRILAHLANCTSMLDAFKAGGDFHSRTAMNMYPHIRAAVERKEVLLEWHPQPGEDKPPVPLLKDAYASERRKAKMLNFSIAYGKTTVGLARDWKVSREEAQETVDLWYSDRQEVLKWQEDRKQQARKCKLVYTLLGRTRQFPSLKNASSAHRHHIERAAINTPVQGSAADVAMCAMLEISKNERLKELGWRLLLQVHDEVILEGPTESAEEAKAIVVNCMSYPFDGKNILRVDLSVDAKCAQNWYDAK